MASSFPVFHRVNSKKKKETPLPLHASFPCFFHAFPPFDPPLLHSPLLFPRSVIPPSQLFFFFSRQPFPFLSHIGERSEKVCISVMPREKKGEGGSKEGGQSPPEKRMEGCIFQEAIAKGGKESVVISWSIFLEKRGCVFPEVECSSNWCKTCSA